MVLNTCILWGLAVLVSSSRKIVLTIELAKPWEEGGNHACKHYTLQQSTVSVQFMGVSKEFKYLIFGVKKIMFGLVLVINSL